MDSETKKRIDEIQVALNIYRRDYKDAIHKLELAVKMAFNDRRPQTRTRSSKM